LPYPLIAGAPYYVISTGLSGSNFEVAGSYGGTGIVFNTASVGTPGNPPWSYFPAASGTQTVNYGGIVALNGSLVAAGVAVLATPQRVLITTSDTTTTFTLIGTGSSGTPQSETLINTSTSIQSNLDYATITSIKVSQGTTAAITVGTNGVGSTPWVRFDDWSVAPVAIQCNVTGTVNYTVQSSLDDPNSAFGTPVTPAAMTWNNTNDSNAVNATSTVQTSFYTGVPVFARVLLNSGSGSVTATFTQSGVVPY
jgi:predicted secreted protein